MQKYPPYPPLLRGENKANPHTWGALIRPFVANIKVFRVNPIDLGFSTNYVA